MKTARDYILESDNSTWLHIDEVEQLMKEYAKQACEKVRDEAARCVVRGAPLGQITRDIRTIDLQQFLP